MGSRMLRSSCVCVAGVLEPRMTAVTSGGLKLQCITIATLSSFACIQALNCSAISVRVERPLFTDYSRTSVLIPGLL